jgi:hypothetical protein
MCFTMKAVERSRVLYFERIIKKRPYDSSANCQRWSICIRKSIFKSYFLWIANLLLNIYQCSKGASISNHSNKAMRRPEKHRNLDVYQFQLKFKMMIWNEWPRVKEGRTTSRVDLAELTKGSLQYIMDFKRSAPDLNISVRGWKRRVLMQNNTNSDRY